jgi:hypothetical protein
MRITLLGPSLLALACVTSLLADEPAADDEAVKKALLKAATEHAQQLELRLARSDDLQELIDHPLLTYGDSARANTNGTLWAWGTKGRPLAMMELYQPANGDRWVHAITLTSTSTVALKITPALKWSPEKTQVAAIKIAGDPPAAKEGQRLRQIKELARRFAAHEFWDPDNSRFELRLLVQPVHRYSDPDRELQDGAVFVLAHGTNPEVLLLIEAVGKSVDTASWQCQFARLGSAEMHVSYDDKEVWTVGRTPNIVGQASDPYWLFFTPPPAREK